MLDALKRTARKFPFSWILFKVELGPSVWNSGATEQSLVLDRKSLSGLHSWSKEHVVALFLVLHFLLVLSKGAMASLGHVGIHSAHNCA